MTKKTFQNALSILLLLPLLGCYDLLENPKPQGAYGTQQLYGSRQYGTQQGVTGYQQQQTGYQQPQASYQQQGQLGQRGGQMQMGGQIQTAGQQQFGQTVGQQQFGQMGGQQFDQTGGQQFGQTGGQQFDQMGSQQQFGQLGGQQFSQRGGQQTRVQFTNTGGAVNSKIITVMIANRFGKLVQVILGPERYMEKNGLDIKNGDYIQVSGTFIDQGQSVFVANSVTKGQKTVQLRNFNGMPIWPRGGYENNFCFWPF